MGIYVNHTQGLCFMFKRERERERERADLDSDSSTSIQHIDWLHHFSHNHSRCRGNEIMIQSLGDKGEWPGYSHIALYHFQLIVLQHSRTSHTIKIEVHFCNNIHLWFTAKSTIIKTQKDIWKVCIKIIHNVIKLCIFKTITNIFSW